jgi:hypothetical protein
MSQSIPRFRHAAPGDVGIFSPNVRRDMLCGLANDLQLPDHSTFRLVIGKGIFVTHGANEFLCFLYRLQDVSDEQKILSLQSIATS